MTASTPHENSARGDSGSLPARPGPRPQTTPRAPHIQQDQNAPASMQAMLALRVFALPEVEERSGMVAHPAERAIWLRDEIAAAPGDVFPGNREIGHFHPWDGNLHIVLDPGVPGVLRLMCQLTFCDRRSARAGSRGSATSAPCRSGLPDLGRRWPRSGISVWSLRSGGYPRVSYWREEVAMCSGDRLVADFIAGTDAWPGLPKELDEHLTMTVNGQWVVWAPQAGPAKGRSVRPGDGRSRPEVTHGAERLSG